jgi:hypothetical protein
MSIKSKIINVSSKLNPLAILGVPKRWRYQAETRLTEMAIEKAKVEIAKRGLEVSNLSEELLELYVAEEREKILSQMKNRSLGAILLLLGIQVV